MLHEFDTGYGILVIDIQLKQRTDISRVKSVYKNNYRGSKHVAILRPPGSIAGEFCIQHLRWEMAGSIRD